MKTLRLCLLACCLFSVKPQLVAQAPVPPNLIRNSYMDLVEGGRPVGFNYNGAMSLQAVHPFTRGFEGTYTATSPANAAATPDAATETSPYWYGVYNKGPRLTRGGMADGWNALTGGKILKITGNNSGAHTLIQFPFEKNGLTGKLRFRAWIKIVSGELVGFGPDAGYLNQAWGTFTVTKATADTGPQGWYYIDQVVSVNRATIIAGNSFCMGLKGDNFEVYLAMPYVTVVEDQSWLPSVSDMLYRDGLFIHPVTQNIGIGTTDTKGYKLAVNGDAVFTKIKVKQYAAWPDYVFEPAYQLPSLGQLAAFINEHRHLPDMPAAAEVAKEEGIDVSEMNTKLLKKVEELTLYLIEQHKRLEEQQERINRQEQQIQRLEERLEAKKRK
jgi:hypothetical protein